MDHYLISPERISISQIYETVAKGQKIELSKESIDKINACREYLDSRLESETDLTLYGINTGFGALHDKRISPDATGQLQYNLVVSHACGTGEPVPIHIVKMMMLLKIHSLSLGHSGIHLDTIKALIELFNAELIPVIYQQGSLGASGDLAPLAHMSLPLLGKGEVYKNGEVAETSSVTLPFQPVQLRSKEGLALLNGTQFMQAYAVDSLCRGESLFNKANLIAAVGIEAYCCRIGPFHHLIHDARNQEGQQKVAGYFYELLKDSPIRSVDEYGVQDPYSFRCIPQVHGASLTAIEHAKEIIEQEINSVTDNPLIFENEGEILSGGNFHGQPIALVIDYLCIAMAELGSISERRSYKLLNGERGLPAFLIPEPGLNSGFMIAQYTAASIVSQNKQLCTPASIDTIDSSKGQEDHVSMGANGVTKCYRVINNLEQILGIEFLIACQAFDLRSMKSVARINEVHDQFRKTVPMMNEDREVYKDIRRSVEFLGQLTVDSREVN